MEGWRGLQDGRRNSLSFELEMKEVVYNGAIWNFVRNNSRKYGI
jgi:hypothetical protein